MAKVILKGYIMVSAADLSRLENELPNHLRLTRAEAGCLIFDVTKDVDIAGKFHVDEEFVDQQSFALHRQRVEKSHWGKVSAGAERFYEITES